MTEPMVPGSYDGAISRIDFPVVLHLDCSVGVDGEGMPIAVGGRQINLCDIEERQSLSNKEIYVDIAFRDPLIGHYFHFMEVFVACAGILDYFLPTAKVGTVFFGGQSWNNKNQNHVQSVILDLILKPRTINDIPNSAGIAAPYLLVIDRQASIDLNYNKFWTLYYELCCAYVPKMKAKIGAALELCPNPYRLRRRPLAIYVSRPPPRTLAPEIKETLFQEVESFGFEVQDVDFGALSLGQQVRTIHNAYLVIGVHGNGLTNVLWQPKGSYVIEIFPDGCHHYDYQFSSELSELNYYGLEAVSSDGFIYTSGCRQGKAYGAPAATIYHLPMRNVRGILTRAMNDYRRILQ